MITYNTCELLIRTPSGQIVNLGKIISTSVNKPEYNTLDVFGRKMHVVSGSTSYMFETINSGDYDGDELIEENSNILDQKEWEDILQGVNVYESKQPNV
jgi:hypothetical protein